MVHLGFVTSTMFLNLNLLKIWSRGGTWRNFIRCRSRCAWSPSCSDGWRYRVSHQSSPTATAGSESSSSCTLAADDTHLALLGGVADTLPARGEVECLECRQPARHTCVAGCLTVRRFQYAGVVEGAVPENVHVLTLEPWGEDGRLLLRLEHFFELLEDPELSTQSSVVLEVCVCLFLISFKTI